VASGRSGGAGDQDGAASGGGGVKSDQDGAASKQGGAAIIYHHSTHALLVHTLRMLVLTSACTISGSIAGFTCN
jgi:hypothetical protein